MHQMYFRFNNHKARIQFSAIKSKENNTVIRMESNQLKMVIPVIMDLFQFNCFFNMKFVLDDAASLPQSSPAAKLLM